MKDFAFALNVFGACLGSLTACLYALRVWQKKECANLATWSIIFILDFVGLYLTYVTGNHEPYIQIGWCIAVTLIVAAAWIRKGDWLWKGTDTVVLVTCAMSVLVWVTSKEVFLSLFGYLAAVYGSSIPQARDYTSDPHAAHKSAWMWQLSLIAILFPISAKLLDGKYGIEHTLVYVALFVLNIIMAALCMRRTTRHTF